MVPHPVNPPTPVTVKVTALEASLAGGFVGVTVMVSPVPGAMVAPPAMVVVGVGADWTMVSEAVAPPKVTVAVPALPGGVVVPTLSNGTLPVSLVVMLVWLIIVPFQVVVSG